MQAAIDALGWIPAKAAKETGIKSQHMSQILTRTEPYRRPPTIKTMQKLERIPGLSQQDILDAVDESMGRPRRDPEEVIGVRWTGNRRTAHNLIDRMPEEKLKSVVEILVALLDQRG